MILTQKAKEDFINWIKEKHYPISLWALEEGLIWRSVEYALIIEWLDSVEIYIIPFMEDDDWQVEIRYGDSVCFNNNFNSRQEATKSAIEKANEIYSTQHFAQ